MSLSQAKRSRELDVCPACSLPLVQPAEWEVATGRRWRVMLSCPSCDWAGDELLDEAAVQRLDEELDRGCLELAAALDRLTALDMREYTQLLVTALAAGAIVPEAF